MLVGLMGYMFARKMILLMLAYQQFSGFIGTAGIDRRRYIKSTGVIPSPMSVVPTENYIVGYNRADQDGRID